MRKLSRALLLLVTVSAAAQDEGRWQRLLNPYHAPYVSGSRFEDSSRIYDLMRAGQIYLSLQDCIALVLENNLDIEVQRYATKIALTDILRAKGGGTLRGLPLDWLTPPAGFGGPGSPLLTAAATGSLPASSLATNISDAAATTQSSYSLDVTSGALSLGPALPVYDPTINGSIMGEHETTPETTALSTGTPALTVNSVTGGIGVVQGFSPGTQVSVGLNTAYQSTNALNSLYQPYNTSNLNLTITQPLLRGFGIGLNRRFIRIAKNNRKLGDLLFREQAINTVAGAIQVYYDFVSLIEDLKVRQETLALAERLYEDNKNKVQQGTLAPIELVRAQAQVAAATQDLANSQGFVLQQELILKNIITRHGTADPVLRAARIVPTSPITIPAQDEVGPVEDLLGQAYRNRPEIAAANIEIENSHISLKGSRNALLPEVDLVGIAQNNGLAGGAGPATFNNGGSAPLINTGGFGTTLSQILQRDYPTYGVGVQINLPLRNRIAQADVTRDELQVRQTEVRQRSVENHVRLEVEDAIVALRRAHSAYQAATETRQLQEQSLEIEQERYAVGLSTNFLVIQYQSYLAQARSTEVASRSAYQKARTELERATGLTLENNDISMDEAITGHINRPPAPLPPPQP